VIFENFDTHATGTELVWLSLSVRNATIHGFFDYEAIKDLHSALGKSLAEVEKNKEKLEEFNSERFHPTGRV
jgi:hypothetical protein